MNISVMKKIDQYVGMPICLALDIVSRFRSIFPVRNIEKPRKILVMKFFGMGSVILSSPMLNGLRNTFPVAEISFLTFASNKDIIERLNLVNNVYCLRTSSFLEFAGDLIRTLLAIRKERFDVTIDMEFFSKFSTIITFLSASPIRIGYYLRQLWRGDLLTHQIYYNHYKHITEVFAALAAPLNVQVENYKLIRPAISAAEIKSALQLLSSVGIQPDEGLICFNVNASQMSLERRWPMKEFVKLATMLLSELKVKVLFIGASSDSQYVKQVTVQIKPQDRVINLAGSTKLGELLAILNKSIMLVSNDSGPLHLAAALGVPTVSFFGPESPMLYAPMGGETLIFYKGLYCSPCLNVFNVKTAPCKGENVCMLSIDAEKVFVAIKDQFKRVWQRYGYQ
jgi:lipopolysaccharide heptosyltransferase II